MTEKKTSIPRRVINTNTRQNRDSFINNNKKRSLEYSAAGDGNRSKNWGATNNSPNASLLGNLDKLRARSRQEMRTNAYANSIVETIVSNVVGVGIKPMTKFKDLQDLWKKWVDECDAGYFSNFYGLQALALRSVIEGGDCFVRMRPRNPEDGLSVPLQLQLIESEHCPATLTQQGAGSNKIIGGVEFSPIGKPVFYHLYRYHPNDLKLNADGNEIVRVPAESVLHLRLMKRAGETRGLPWLSNILVKLHELDIYLESELTRKKTAALFGGWILTPGNDDDAEVLAGITGTIEDDVVIDPLEPGSFPVLPPGYSVQFSNPVDVGGNFQAFMRAELLAISQATGVTYEQLTGDFSTVNDRTLRASLLEFKRRASMWQWHLMIQQFCKPVWKQFVDMAILSGAWTPPADATDAEIYGAKWTPHNWGYLHPVQEIAAYKDAIRSGLTSRSRVVSELGEDVETIDEEISADNARIDELGMILDTDPRRLSKAGLTQVRPTTTDYPSIDDGEDGEDDSTGDL